MHMTLGVMALEEEASAGLTSVGTSSGRAASPDISAPAVQRKTVSTALRLLMSLSPQISEILKESKMVKVPLEVMDVLKTEKMLPQGQSGKKASVAEENDSHGRKKEKRPERDDYYDRVGAGVLFVGPQEMAKNLMDEERQKLMGVCGVFSFDSRSTSP